MTTKKSVEVPCLVDQLQQTEVVESGGERLEYARLVCEALSTGRDTATAVQLAKHLAVDRDWQVRDRIAEVLQWVPDEHLPWFSPVAIMRDDD